MIEEETKEKKHNYFYRITNQINWKYYFGIHSTGNLNDGYLGSSKLLKDAIKKYGKENFHLTIIEDYPTRKEASDHEKLAVTMDQVLNENCYNLQLGGDSGGYCRHSPTTIEKIREAGTGRVMSEECIEKRKTFWRENPQSLIDKAYKGVKTRRSRGKHLHSSETRKLISEKEFEFARNGGVKAKHYECEINGQFFKTMKAVCSEFNIGSRECTKRLLSTQPEWQNWIVLGNELPKEEKKEYKRDKRFKRCEIDGVVYDNFKIASIELELDEAIVKERLESTDFENYQLLETENKNSYNYASIKCIINGMIFNSFSEAGKYFNISGDIAGYRVKTKAKKWKSWKYYNEET